MILTRRQVIALFMGAAAGPAIGESDVRPPVLRVGDIVTWAGIPGEYLVTEVPEDEDCYAILRRMRGPGNQHYSEMGWISARMAERWSVKRPGRSEF
jgi:hypothetical protein